MAIVATLPRPKTAAKPATVTPTSHVVLQPVASGLAPLVVPITDPATVHSAEAATTATLPRPGLKPYMYWTGQPLRTAQLTFTLWNGDSSSVDPLIASLQAMVNVKMRVVNYGRMMTGQWWLTTLEIDPQRRVAGSNEPMWATVTATFTEASDDDIVTGATTVVTHP